MSINRTCDRCDLDINTGGEIEINVCDYLPGFLSTGDDYDVDLCRPCHAKFQQFIGGKELAE